MISHHSATDHYVFSINGEVYALERGEFEGMVLLLRTLNRADAERLAVTKKFSQYTHLPAQPIAAEALRLFALDVLGDWPEGAPDDGELQGIAIKHGLLIPTPTVVPCGENCTCAEYYDEGDRIDCLHRAPFLITPPAALSQGGKP
jgi:hypothetical protein